MASQGNKLANAPLLAGEIPTNPGACEHRHSSVRWSAWLALVRLIFSIDLRALAALRIGVSLLLLIDLSQRAEDLIAHYSDTGLMPRAVVIDKVLESPWCISVHFI